MEVFKGGERKAPLSRPQTRTPLRHKKNSKKDKTSLPMQRKFYPSC